MNEQCRRFTNDELSDSLFYPACGTDLQPVLMMAGKIQTYVYTDWNRSEKEVVEAFQNFATTSLQLLRSFSVSQELYGRACLRTVCNNPRSRHFRRHVMGDEDVRLASNILPSSFQLIESEIAAYDQRRRTVGGVSKPWAREFVFNYTGCRQTRTLKLLYFSDEGLVRYSVLYYHRRLAPAFVYTVESGAGFGHGWTTLEEPGGRFENFLFACDPRPHVWIRKAWHDKRQRSHWNQRSAQYSFGRIKAFIHGESSRLEMHSQNRLRSNITL